MAQHDMNIANQSFPSFRTDLNNALSALNTMHSGTSRPSGAAIGTMWLDTTNSGSNSLTIKFFDGSDDISFATIDTSANTVNFLDSVVGGVTFKEGGTNFTDSLLIGHSTTGTLDEAIQNTGVGANALDAITSGDANTAVGRASGTSITTAGSNTSIGATASHNLATGSGNNTTVGISADFFNVSGGYNTAVGVDALKGASSQSHDFNTALGRRALYVVTTGDYNIGIGHNAGKNITSGSGNVIIGEVDAGSATGSRQLLITGNDGSTATTWISGDSSGNIVVSGTTHSEGGQLTTTGKTLVLGF